ncbi:NAD(P)/FAD-dependent oxidoreductase [Maricurvus nonylphenolicus]|uniref:phytoene desaturase family protein n=1 Tax=Maricurvus nonylphenolicus TaxID=1008307 RepID=UPI0036F242B2
MTYVGKSFKALALDAHYDAIVIGSGMGGLSVSSVLAQKGKKVLLLEQHNIIGGCTHAYARKGYEWNIGLHYIGDMHSKSTMTHKLFDYVTQSGIDWQPMPEVYNRIYVAGKEYPFYQGAGAYAANLKEYFPQESAAIDEYMRLMQLAVSTSRKYFALKAMPSKLSEQLHDELAGPFMDYANKTTYEVLSSLTDNQELIAVICGNYGDYSLPPKRSAFAMHAMLVRHYMESAYYPSGGAASLAKSIVPIIEKAGGDVFYSAEVETILMDGEKAIGVKLKSGEEISASTVISNAGVNNTFAKLVPEASQHKTTLMDGLDQVEQAYCAVGLNIGFNKSAEELGLHGANIWAHPSNDLDGNVERHKRDFNAPFPWSFITFPSAKDPSWDERFEGKSTIEMFCATDFEHFKQWSGTPWKKRGEDYEALKQDIAQRMFAELYRYAPQLEGHVDYFEVSTPVTYQNFLRRDTGNFMGIEASPERFQQQWLRADTPIDGLYLTGQDVTTDGVISALMAGVITSSRILGEDIAGEIAKG